MWMGPKRWRGAHAALTTTPLTAVLMVSTWHPWRVYRDGVARKPTGVTRPVEHVLSRCMYVSRVVDHQRCANNHCSRHIFPLCRTRKRRRSREVLGQSGIEILLVCATESEVGFVVGWDAEKSMRKAKSFYNTYLHIRNPRPLPRVKSDTQDDKQYCLTEPADISGGAATVFTCAQDRNDDIPQRPYAVTKTASRF